VEAGSSRRLSMTNPAGGMSINSVVAHFEQDVDCLPLQQAYLDSPDTHIIYVGIELFHKERLVALSKLFHECKLLGIVSFKKTGCKTCIFGFSKLVISDVVEFHKRARAMVLEKGINNCWNISGRPVTNPTYGVYQVFRTLDLLPSHRGPSDTDPGKTDWLYYKEWHYKPERFDQSNSTAKYFNTRGVASGYVCQ